MACLTLQDKLGQPRDVNKNQEVYIFSVCGRSCSDSTDAELVVVKG